MGQSIRPEAQEAFASGRRADVTRHISEHGPQAAARQLILMISAYATALTTAPGAFDHYLRLIVCVHDLRERGIDMKGKWLETPTGYIFVSASGGSGRYERRLPSDVPAHDVLADPAKTPSAWGRERLAALLDVLGTFDWPAGLRDALEDASRFGHNALAASGPDGPIAAWRHWSAGVAARVREAVAQRHLFPPGDAVRLAYGEALARMEASYGDARVDAVTAGTAQMLLLLYGGTHAVAGDAASTAVLLTGLDVSTTSARASGELAIDTLARVEPGILKGVARKVLELADEAIDAALDAPADPVSFYNRLRVALPTAWAAQELTRGWVRTQGELAEGDDEMARLANVAEERHVRVQHSLHRWPVEYHFSHMREDRSRVGDLLSAGDLRGARRLTTELIEQHYFYPRAMRPLFLQTS